MKGFSFWVPDGVKKGLVGEHLKMYFGHADCFLDGVISPKQCWIVVGRPGNHLAESVAQEVKRCEEPMETVMVTVGDDDRFHGDLMNNLLDLVEKQRERVATTAAGGGSGVGLLVILDQGYRLALSQDGTVQRQFNKLPETLKGTHTYFLICCEIPTSKLPEGTRFAFQYQAQVFFASPDDKWRKGYLARQFQQYKDFVESNIMCNYVEVNMSNDDIDFLVECSAYATMDEMHGFVQSCLNHVHKMTPGVKRTLDLELCKLFLKDKGGCLNLSDRDGYQQEQEYMQGSGMRMGLPDLPDRTDRTITNKKVYENGGVETLPFKMLSKPAEEVPITFDSATKKREIYMEDAEEDGEPDKKKNKV